VGVFQRLRDLPHDLNRTLQRNDPALLHEVGDVGSFDVLEGNIQVAVRFSRVEDGDDVLVAQIGGCLGLGLKPFNQGGVARLVARENLEGTNFWISYLPIFLACAGAVAGGSPADLADDCDGPPDPVGEDIDHLKRTSQPGSRSTRPDRQPSLFIGSSL
jgi:hypothetical protein